MNISTSVPMAQLENLEYAASCMSDELMINSMTVWQRTEPSHFHASHQIGVRATVEDQSRPKLLSAASEGSVQGATPGR
jgi:hypothetical protein